MTAPLVDVVVCTRNNRTIIGPTLEAIRAQTGVAVSCYVVDGQSTDGTPEHVRLHYPWVHVCIKDTDNGPAASRNIGCSMGVGKYVVFLDSDARLAPDWCEQQIRFFERRNQTGMVSGKLLLAADPLTLDCAYGAMNRYGVAWNQGAGEAASAYEREVRCLWGCTAAVMVRREALERIGGFDETFFAYHEDTDLGWRANLFGYQVWFNPAAVAFHDVHGTMNGSTMGNRITYLLWRNRLRSALVNYEAASVFRYLSGYLALSIAHLLAWSPRAPKLRALAWNVLHLADTLRTRRKVQVGRSVRDDELWHLFRPGFRGPSRHSGPSLR